MPEFEHIAYDEDFKKNRRIVKTQKSIAIDDSQKQSDSKYKYFTSLRPAIVHAESVKANQQTVQ